MTEELRIAIALLVKICKQGYYGKITFQIENGKPMPIVRREETTKLY
jgi:hypothetical protein